MVFFVGDGMGISTVTAARILKGQLAGMPGEETVLAWENFPNVALAKVNFRKIIGMFNCLIPKCI